MENRPPKLLLRFFRWFCNPDFAEDIEGDLLEKFEGRTEQRGLKFAKWKFFLDVLLLFRPGVIRSLSEGQNLNQLDMLQNYLKVALRNMHKQKFYAALNILGLSLGLTASLLIGLYIYDELTFDKFHHDYQNIYEVGLHLNFAGQEYKTTGTCPPLAQALKIEIAGIQQVTRLNPWLLQKVVVRHSNKAFTETKAVYADPNFFQFFSFKLLAGNPKTVLKNAGSVVLTPASAQKYFGGENAIGKSLLIGNENKPYEVTGIAEPAPASSHIQYDMLLSSQSDEEMKNGGWGDNNGTYTYLRKAPTAEVTSIELGLANIVNKYVAPRLEDDFAMTFEEFQKGGGIYSYLLFPMADSHLFRPDISDIPKSGDKKSVYAIGAAGLFILLIACINFMNLFTARSASRAREVGLRKTFGSGRDKLIIQFLSESFIYVITSFIIAVIMIYILLPAFNELSGKTISLFDLMSPFGIGTLILLLIVVAFLSGTYPAFYLTAFKPLSILRGNMSSGIKSQGIRSTLVVIQFTISIALIICTAVIFNQIQFLQGRDIGLDKFHVLQIENANRLGNNQEAFLEAIGNQSGIVACSYLDNSFPGMNEALAYRKSGTNQDFILPTYKTDYKLLDVLKIGLVEGRYFSKEFASDTLAIVLNEAAVKELEFSDPLNESLIIYLDPVPITHHVVGVVQNFNFESPELSVRPLVIVLKENSNNLLVRYNPKAYTSTAELITSINTIWNKHTDNEPFEYAFLDRSFDSLFSEEKRSAQLLTIISFIAIFVSCLGLLGLAAFTAEQRTREIGIRKVLGASVASINSMLSKQFMLLVIVSFVIASSIGWYVMNEWLSTYTYRIELEPVVFLVAGTAAAVIAWLTVSYHFIKAARSNPIDAIRNE